MNDTTHDASTDETRPDGGATSEPVTQEAAAADGDLAALRQERDELRDRLLRQTAEFDNFRKRTERERRELLDHAAGDVLLEILPIIDDIERAIGVASASDEPAVIAYGEGLELIRQQCLELLAKFNARPVKAVGAQFDPNVHEAVEQVTSDTHEEGEVIEELRRGYLLKDRLLRAAMVRVATRG